MVLIIRKKVITLVVEKNFNLLINEKTGKWLCFKYPTVPQIIRNITENQFRTLFRGYSECEDIICKFDVLEQPQEVINDLLQKANYLVLHVSDRCNMHCEYCYAEDNELDREQIMDSETMIKAIDKFLDNCHHLNVLFHGREPLTNYSNILRTLEHYCDNKRISFTLQTNGVLLTDDKINQLKKHNVEISVSMDGISDKANKLRINGETSLNYTKRIIELVKKYHLSVITIIHNENIDELLDIRNFLIRNGLNSAAFNFLWPTRENPMLENEVVSQERLIVEMKRLFLTSIEDDRGKKFFDFKERDLFLLYGRVVFRHINNYMCNKSPCGAGKNCFSVNYNGDVYACTTVNKQKENYMGNILHDLLADIISREVELRKRNIDEIEDCNECPYSIFCGGGGCAGFIYNSSGNVNSKSIYCDYYKEMIRFLIEYSFECSRNKFFIN